MCMALLICILKIIFGGAAEIICVVQVMKSAPCKMFSEKDKRHRPNPDVFWALLGPPFCLQREQSQTLVTGESYGSKQ